MIYWWSKTFKLIKIVKSKSIKNYYFALNWKPVQVQWYHKKLKFRKKYLSLDKLKREFNSIFTRGYLLRKLIYDNFQKFRTDWNAHVYLNSPIYPRVSASYRVGILYWMVWAVIVNNAWEPMHLPCFVWYIISYHQMSSNCNQIIQYVAMTNVNIVK